MFLAVTPLEEFWDKDDELLFVGPWCAPYTRRDRWSRLRHRFVPDPWKDLARYESAVARANALSARMMEHLADYLNRTHGTSHDLRYWRLLLNPWLDFHIQQLYDHFVLIEEAYRIDPSPRTILLDPLDYETPLDMGDFVRLMIGDRYQLQLFSHILSSRQPEAPKRRMASPSPGDPAYRRLASETTDPSLRGGFKGFAKRASATIFRVLKSAGAGRVCVSESGLSRPQLAQLILRSGFRVLPSLAELPLSTRRPPIFDERRLALARLPAADEFQRVLVSSLPCHLPAIFLEGYQEARRATLAATPHPPKIFFSSAGFHYIDATKFAAAENVERGSRLWGMQHGAGYGIASVSWAEGLERAACDRYFAWGWAKIDGDPRVRNLPSPHLSRAAKLGSQRVRGEDILYVTTSLDLHNIRLIRDTNGSGAMDAIERESRFLRALPDGIRARTLMRVFRHDWGWNHRERLRDLCPTARFDDSFIPLGHRIDQARLVVVDIPSTPMLEALVAGVPCLMTWSPDTWPFRPSARPFFDAMRDTGVLIDSPEEAAAQAARIYQDPSGWWNESSRRTARLELIRTFALSNSDWISDWLREFNAGLNEKYPSAR